MRKKTIAVFVSLALFLFTSLSMVNASERTASGLKVIIDGQSWLPQHSGWVMQQTLYVAYADLAQALGAQILWNPSTKTVVVTKEGNTIELRHGSAEATVNGVLTSTDMPVYIIHGTTYGPIRFLAPFLGSSVQYDKQNRTVVLTATKEPGFHVIGVKPNAIVYGDKLKLSVAVNRFKLADFRSHSETMEDQGHIHVWLDTDASNPKAATKLVNSDALQFDALPVGEHTLTVQLVGNDHKPVQPEAKQVIHFTSVPKPSLSIVSPIQGSQLKNDKVTVKLNIANFKLMDFRHNSLPTAGQGHVHLWLDTDSSNPKIAVKLTDANGYTFTGVKPGKHKLTVQLVGNDHRAIPGISKQIVNFNTQQKATAPTHPCMPAAPSTLQPSPNPSKPPVKKPVPTKTYAVDIADYSFQPGSLTIKAGSKVIFTNKDDVKHTATEKGGAFDSGLLSKGESYTYTFSKAGEYNVYCKPHPMMTLKIVVQ